MNAKTIPCATTQLFLSFQIKVFLRSAGSFFSCGCASNPSAEPKVMGKAHTCDANQSDCL